MKQATHFFDRKIPINQLGFADRIFRASFLLQNFKLPFIQERSDNTANTGRPCKCEVRLYGATDDGLVDVRPEVELWGLESEIERWHVLRNDEHNNNLSDTEISELVFAEDWLEKLKEVHVAKLNSATS